MTMDDMKLFIYLEQLFVKILQSQNCFGNLN